MPRLRILADDLTGALDCAAAFGAGIPVHLAQPPAQDEAPVSIVATATRDIAPADLPAHLASCVPWLAQADIAFKKVDSLLRGNTFDELDHVARAGRFAGLALAPAFPGQGRITVEGMQCIVRDGQAPVPVDAPPMPQALAARGWTIHTGVATPALEDRLAVAWVPELRDDDGLTAVARVALGRTASRWLWAGSAGLAGALSRLMQPATSSLQGEGQAGARRIMLVSASHHPVTRSQWQALRQSRHAADCHDGAEPSRLLAQGEDYPRLIDLSPRERITAQEAASLLATQMKALAQHAPQPDELVLVGGDTLLALCQALGVQALMSHHPMNRSGWGCARMVGGRWNGLVCHTRSGAFGQAGELVEVLDTLAA